MRSRPLPQLSRTQELMCTLSRLIQGKMLLPGITASQLFVYARDAAFFKTLFFSEDQANDLTLVKNQEIMRFPRMVSCSITYSEEGYDQRTYLLRLINEQGDVYCSFIVRKGRVTPMKAHNSRVRVGCGYYLSKNE